MKRASIKTIKIAGLVVIITVGILGLFAIWLYTGQLTESKIKIFTKLPLPIASVNGRFIYLPSYTLRWQAYQLLSQNKLTIQSPETAKTAIFEQIVKDQEMTQIALQHGIYIDARELETEYSAQTMGESENNFLQSLEVYGLSKNSYEQYVIKPQLFKIKMLTWFNSQADLNPNQSSLANNLTGQIKAGQDMSVLAKQFSQEDTGKIVGGDMGFIDPTELLLEMREPIYSMNAGEVKIIPSRAGINIIKLEEKQSNKFHLRQIFLLPENFQAWLEAQTKNFKIYKLINF